jgi:DNA-binding protein WhiA
MSFASETKNELCRTDPAPCCRRAECYGILLFGRNFNAKAVSFSTENGAAAHRAARFAEEITGAVPRIASSSSGKTGERIVHTVSVEGAAGISGVLNSFGHTGNEISLRINLANLENECCRSAFLRGVFLACGSVTDPRRDYHLEYVVPYRNLARDLSGFLLDIEELNLQPGFLNRKGSFVVYVKGSERVADLLTFMGAPSAAMQLMQVKMLKEVRNNVNRKTNFETANIDKTATAAAQQVLAIEKLMKSPAYADLPEELKELALLRLRNPDMSLRELGENLSRPLSRSGVDHRLRRILELGGKA